MFLHGGVLAELFVATFVVTGTFWLVCAGVRLEVCRLCKFLVASIKGADVGPVARVDSFVGAKV